MAIVVEWDGGHITWETFNHVVIGDKNPSIALPSSIRGNMFANWDTYWNMMEPPSIHDNGIHSSSSAFAALSERMRYYDGTLLYTDVLGARLLRCRFRTGDINYWLQDPILANGVTLFDTLAGKGTEECIEILSTLDENSYKKL